MIRQEERFYKSDGIVTQAERRDLQRDLDAASRLFLTKRMTPTGGGPRGNSG